MSRKPNHKNYECVSQCLSEGKTLLMTAEICGLSGRQHVSYYKKKIDTKSVDLNTTIK